MTQTWTSNRKKICGEVPLMTEEEEALQETSKKKLGRKEGSRATSVGGW